MKMISRPTPRSFDPMSVEGRLLAAVPATLRPRVEDVLARPRCGGRGLHAWLALLEADHPPLPAELSAELVAVYLEDGEAEPLHDCEACGLRVPVRAVRRCGHEPAVERVYFPACPHCGGRTGRHAYWSRPARRGTN